MPPKQDRKEVKEDYLTAIVIVDSFDNRFSPISHPHLPWSMQKLCNVPILHYTISWIARTECRNLILVVSNKNLAALKEIEKEWSSCFVDFSIVSSSKLMSVGDAVRELESRGKIQGDFLLISNPVTITISTLKKQIEKFRELRKADKAANVMTLIYSSSENLNKEVIAVNRQTNRLRLYHREDDITSLDIDKKCFAEELLIRRDVTDTGIAICAINIAAQFSDNFDFQHTDNVIRELLVNEEILCQNIYVDVLPQDEAVVCVNDYDTLLLAQALLMEHWFGPISPNWMPCVDGFGNVALDRNVFILTAVKTLSEGRSPNLPAFSGHTVCVGRNYVIGEHVLLQNVVFGNNVTIGCGCELKNCLIGDNCVIERNGHLENVVLGDNVRITDGTHISDAVIGSGVVYPADMKYPKNAAVCSIKPDDDDDSIQADEQNGLYLWRLKTSDSFWKYGGRQNVTRNPPYEYDSVAFNNHFDSEPEEDEGIENPVKTFLYEVTDSMTRIRSLPFKDELMNNLTLEINSSRLANNISVDDVGKNVFLSFLSLEGVDNINVLKTLAKQWERMFKNYYRKGDKKAQIQLLLGLEEKHKEVTASFPAPRCAKIVQILFDEEYKLELIEEDALIAWHSSLPELDLKKSVSPLVEWLQDSEDDSD